jgi:hypothetical protein
MGQSRPTMPVRRQAAAVSGRRTTGEIEKWFRLFFSHLHPWAVALQAVSLQLTGSKVLSRWSTSSLPHPGQMTPPSSNSSVVSVVWKGCSQALQKNGYRGITASPSSNSTLFVIRQPRQWKKPSCGAKAFPIRSSGRGFYATAWIFPLLISCSACSQSSRSWPCSRPRASKSSYARRRIFCSEFLESLCLDRFFPAMRGVSFLGKTSRAGPRKQRFDWYPVAKYVAG